MEIQRKALFNLLRMNWLLKPAHNVMEWQVEDYRALSTQNLFERLEKEEIRLDIPTFVSEAEPFETPEELTNDLLLAVNTDTATEDRIYLVVFELWRRLMPEKSCLSIFCDELDYQIARYDTGELETTEHLEDVLANLRAMLDENTDLGNDPKEVFQTVSEASANDLEDFLYDFIAAQIDHDNVVYASELIDGFYQYVTDVKWFDLLHARVLAAREPAEARAIIRQCVDNWIADHDLAFNLEALAFMIIGGERESFTTVVRYTLPHLKHESDVQDLLNICAEYFQRIDHDNEESQIHQWLAARAQRESNAPVDTREPLFGQLLNLFGC